jgi:hypothetical protein
MVLAAGRRQVHADATRMSVGHGGEMKVEVREDLKSDDAGIWDMPVNG